MLEKLITSKTRVKILKLFLANIDDRYYLRELERMLDESLSPLRRQLIKLERMGILITEDEANLKYYRLNKNFAGIGELRKLVLGNRGTYAELEKPAEPMRKEERTLSGATPVKRIRYDVMVLSVISILVLCVATFVLYTSSKNISQVASMFSDRTMEVADITERALSGATPTRPNEMVSRKWKVFPGGTPVFSSGETGGRSEEL